MKSPAYFLLFAALTCPALIGACSDDLAPASESIPADASTPINTAGGGSSGLDGGSDAGGSSGSNSIVPTTDSGTSSDSGMGVLISGDGYGVVYSEDALIGIDARLDCEASFDEDGNLIGYDASAMEQLDIGDATLRSAGSDGTVAWGTWVGGPTTGVFYATTDGDFTFDEDTDGFHYAVGKIASELPTGTVSYTLSGASAPTTDTGAAPGALESASVVIDYDAGTVGVQLVVMTEDGESTYTTTGGTDDLSATEGAIFEMGFHANAGTGGLRGAIIDDGAALAIAYVFEHSSSADGGALAQLRGAAGLVRE